jgi:hypothetical protein
MSNQTCPYCQIRPCESDDHIFLDALGGRATIRACKPCNDKFGHTFEGQSVTNFFHPLLIMLRDAGVPVLDPGAKWKGAAVASDGVVYDLKMGSEGRQSETGRPVVKRDATNPKRFEVFVGDDSAGHKLLKQFFDPKKFRVLEKERVPVTTSDLKLDFGTNPEIKRTALKTAFAAASKAFSEATFLDACRQELQNGNSPVQPECVAFDMRDLPLLDEQRQPLCHVAYVERCSGKVHGFVQFFGAFQFWADLATSLEEQDKGFIGILDPVSGLETFREVPVLGLPSWRSEQRVNALLPINKFNENAASRGARPPGVLKLNQITIDGEIRQPFQAT